ncbi:PIN domain-like protein [Piptocephalis cylindrospora]|uniref:Exonuclease 1 n=1 Tax=Piptocephalis cylindrospora TaxID=1907219 RepID=A0A4P9Y3P8_9FUNG|nr:PIN domain-like protein [Piptocephalis cylindrospora]|eukprot:RKP12751.1 PIN domain-like protein [Piptocephalis cylindrospora]
MGISGLLPALKAVQEKVHVSAYSGTRVAVDAYVWLHRGVLGCATDLALGRDTKRYVNYCMELVGMLRHHGVKPVLIFDGGHLPAKASTEQERYDKRQKSLKEGLALHKAGREREAAKKFQTAIDVTPVMARDLILELKKMNVEYVVAPYEADAQMAYLARAGQVSAVITEDSDLLVYQCPRVLYKMDRYGDGYQVLYDNIARVQQPMDLSHLSPKAFRYMCILSGCDYAASIYSMGLKRAYKYAIAHETPEAIVRAAERDGMVVPSGYLQTFHLANHTFLYQRVWDPKEGQLTSVESPIPLDISTQPYIGALMDAEQARGVVEGRVDPMTLQPFPTALVPTWPRVGLSVVATSREKKAIGALVKLESEDGSMDENKEGAKEKKKGGVGSSTPDRRGFGSYA